MKLLSHKIPDTPAFLEVFADLDEQGHVLPALTYQTVEEINHPYGVTRRSVTPHGSLSDAVEAAMWGHDEVSVLFQVAMCSQLAFSAYMKTRNNLSTLPPKP